MATRGRTLGYTYLFIEVEGHCLVRSLGVPLLYHLKLTTRRWGAFQCVIEIETLRLHYFLPPSNKVVAVSEGGSGCPPTTHIAIPPSPPQSLIHFMPYVPTIVCMLALYVLISSSRLRKHCASLSLSFPSLVRLHHLPVSFLAFLGVREGTGIFTLVYPEEAFARA